MNKGVLDGGKRRPDLENVLVPSPKREQKSGTRIRHFWRALLLSCMRGLWALKGPKKAPAVRAIRKAETEMAPEARFEGGSTCHDSFRYQIALFQCVLQHQTLYE